MGPNLFQMWIPAEFLEMRAISDDLFIIIVVIIACTARPPFVSKTIAGGKKKKGEAATLVFSVSSFKCIKQFFCPLPREEF